MNPGSSGSWDSSAVLDPCVLKDTDGTFKMYYVGYGNTSNGNPNIGLATSRDGINWTKYAGNPVLAPSESYDGYMWEARVIKDNDTYKMWYQAANNASSPMSTNYATSSDGIRWTKYSGNPVLTPTAGSWDASYAGVRYVIKANNVYNMYYETNTAVGNDGLATSSDGINWTKYSGNPILTSSPGQWDYANDIPNVILKNGVYYIYYSTNSGPPSRVGLATSTDGMNFTKDTSSPIINLVGTSSTWDTGSRGELVSLMQPDDSGKLYGYYRGISNGLWSIGLLSNLTLENITTNTSTTLSVNSFLDYTSGSAGYYFYQVADPTHNSGWIRSNTWTDTGLTPDTSYDYYVKYRNSDGIELAYATTDYPIYTMSSASPLTVGAISQNSITLSWAGDSSDYYLENTTNNTNPGWLTSSPYIFSELSCGTNYSFRIKGRNAGGAETDWSTINISSAPCPLQGSSPVIGCTDSKAANYNPQAAIGSSLLCKYNIVPPLSVPAPTVITPVFSRGGQIISEIQKVTRDLRLGTVSNDVKTLQSFLIAESKGYYAKTLAKNGVTNNFGKLTKLALIEWQKAMKITPASGVFGPKTRAKVKLLGL